MIFEKVLIFILFLGPLVFFHELGHFLFARFFGVKVEVFSIGFGPKFFKFKKGDTQYALSLIPLGGYVKMYGDDPFKRDEIPESERQQSFVHKGKFARFCIVVGGPLANFIMAYAIFFGLLISGEKIPEMRLGVIPSASKLYKQGVRSGDVITNINGKSIFNPTDMAIEGDGILKSLEVIREGKSVVLSMETKGKDFFKEIVKYPPGLLRPILFNKTGEYFAVSLSSSTVDWSQSLDTFALHTKNEKLTLYLFSMNPDQLKDGFDKITLSPTPKHTLNLLAGTRLELLGELDRLNYRSLDLVVKSISMNSAADHVGLKASDAIVALNGKRILSFSQLRETLQAIKEKKVKLIIWQKGVEKEVELEPKIKVVGEAEVKLIGVYSAGSYLLPKHIHIPSSGLLGAFTGAFSRTLDSISKTLDGFLKLITAEVSFKAIGGPFTIGKVAADSFNTSLTYFFQLMALISVNLGVINLFPIPVLDGGHIMFIILEFINGGPVSRKKMEIAQQIGLSMLLLLMVGALFNDFTRFF